MCYISRHHAATVANYIDYLLYHGSSMYITVYQTLTEAVRGAAHSNEVISQIAHRTESDNKQPTLFRFLNIGL